MVRGSGHDCRKTAMAKPKAADTPRVRLRLKTESGDLVCWPKMAGFRFHANSADPET